MQFEVITLESSVLRKFYTLFLTFQRKYSNCVHRIICIKFYFTIVFLPSFIYMPFRGLSVFSPFSL